MNNPSLIIALMLLAMLSIINVSCSSDESEESSFSPTNPVGNLDPSPLVSKISIYENDTLGEVTSYKYNNNKQLSKIIYSESEVIFNYTDGKISSTTKTNKDGSSAASFNFVYDSEGKILSSSPTLTGRNNFFSEHHYDSLGRIQKSCRYGSAASLEKGNCEFQFEFRYDNISNKIIKSEWKQVLNSTTTTYYTIKEFEHYDTSYKVFFGSIVTKVLIPYSKVDPLTDIVLLLSQKNIKKEYIIENDVRTLHKEYTYRANENGNITNIDTDIYNIDTGALIKEISHVIEYN